METMIFLLLLLVLVCLVLLLVFVLHQNNDTKENQIHLLMKAQENVTQNATMKEQFQSVNAQMQNLRKEQAASYQVVDTLSHQMQMINRVMTNTKARGSWGEYQLEHLLSIYAGSNPAIYSMQYTLSNGKIADAVFHLPNTEKVLCIDSKFPMENYLSQDEKAFRRDVCRHIDAIADKYIMADTIHQAILFLPSEAIYQTICASHQEIAEYALERHVLLCSPATLVGTVTTLLASTKDFYRAGHMEEIEKNILSLQKDVERLIQRSEKAEKTLMTLSGQFHDVAVSANKIASRMERMADGKEDV